nr:potassium-transporting ATPase subunit KdpC [Thermosporothrix hazakensis]
MSAVKNYIRPAVLITILLVIITGLIYPGIVTGLAQLLFPYQANGSIHMVNGKPIGSDLIGQYWTEPKYFHGRPSVTVSVSDSSRSEPYNAQNSTASNQGPTNQNLTKAVEERIAELKKENPDVKPGTPIPVDLVTASGSGLDPDITLAGAEYQVPRIAKARGISEAQVEQVIKEHTQGRFLGFLGEPHVNVLELNLALDALKQ